MRASGSKLTMGLERHSLLNYQLNDAFFFLVFGFCCCCCFKFGRLVVRCKWQKRFQRLSCLTLSFNSRKEKQHTVVHIASDWAFSRTGGFCPLNWWPIYLRAACLIPASDEHPSLYLLPCGFSLLDFDVLPGTLLATGPQCHAYMCSDKHADFNTSISTCSNFKADLTNLCHCSTSLKWITRSEYLGTYAHLLQWILFTLILCPMELERMFMTASYPEDSIVTPRVLCIFPCLIFSQISY